MSKNAKINILDVKKITNNKHINLFNITYTDKASKNKIWQVASRQNDLKFQNNQFDLPDAVMIIPFHIKKKCLCIIKEFRIALNDYQYEFPAGLVDKGETIKQACQRELSEETGLMVSKVIRITQPLFTSAGMSDESISLAFVECTGDINTKKNEDSEDISAFLISQDEAYSICNNPNNKIDAKTWPLLYSYAENGFN